MNPNRLLVIDDQPEIGAFIGEVAEENGYDVAITTTSEAFWETHSSLDPTVITLDLQMPQTDGIELLRTLAERHCLAGILLISGQDHRVLSSAKRLGADRGLNMLGVLPKPVQLEALEAVLNTAKLDEPALSEEELRVAIESDQLIVYYQPKIACVSDSAWKIEGAEALVRWRHPRRGLVMPDDFIPMAERSGLIASLTDYVLTSAIDQMKQWRDQGSALCVAVNIAPVLLSDLDMPDRVFRMMEERAVPPSALTLEITESGAMTDTSLTMDILTRFRIKGFGLSLDDFGTGYSSLVQLYGMPFNEMKVDKSFVMALEQDPDAEAIVKLIIDLAHNLGLTACAEGVESETALRILQTFGCETAQGYFIGAPEPAAAMVPVIDKWSG